MRGHVIGQVHVHLPVKVYLDRARFEQVRTWQVTETLWSVAGVAQAACEPWLAEASQERRPRRRHLLEDNPTSG